MVAIGRTLTAGLGLSRWGVWGLLLLAGQGVMGQAVVQGRSTTHSGMLYYDVDAADDRVARTYVYTLCPDSSSCLSIDFNLVKSRDPQDFIKVYEGVGKTGKLLGTLGGKSGSLLLLGQSECITFEFERSGAGIHSTWTALWRSQKEGGCLDTYRPSDADHKVQDVCGPEYKEAFHYFGPSGQQVAEYGNSCVQREHNSAWYRFMACKDGPLEFSIVPNNGFDDYDWVLWKPKAGQAHDLGTLDSVGQRLACNYAAGRGAGGVTGMSPRGERAEADASGSPYSSRVVAKRGDVFYLLIDDYSHHSTGFTLKFNDVVAACENAERDVLDMGQIPDLREEKRPRDAFMRYSRVLRLDLDTKANRVIGSCAVGREAYAQLGGVDKRNTCVQVDEQVWGISEALLCGLRGGGLKAYRPDDPSQPLHYGDLLELAYRSQAHASADPVPSGDYWYPGRAALAPFTEYIELLVDETIDRNSGQQRRQIRYVRLLWADGEGNLPDFNAALFRYQDLRDLLEGIRVPSPQNDAGTMTLHDYLEGQLYEAITVERSGRGPRTLGEAKFQEDRQVELENYIWGW